jgi:putative transposase
MTRQLAIDALQMALDQRKPLAGLVHHSDRGSQYAAVDYQKLLSKYDITCSMSRKGNCYDNAVAESFFHLLKTEWVNHHRYLTRSEAISSLFYYIEIFYNRKRRHSSLNYLTPQQYEHFSLAA